MTDERTAGIILRTRRLTETSLIVQWLTPDLGRISTVAKGACRPKSSFRGKLDLYYEAEFSFQRSRRSELHTLREVSLRGTHPELRTDLGRLEQLSYFSCLIEQTTERETPLPEFYALMIGAVQGIGCHAPGPQSVFAFEIKLLELLGMAPELSTVALSEGSRHLLSRLKEADWDFVFRMQLSPPQMNELRQFLHGYLSYHLDRIPESRSKALRPD